MIRQESEGRWLAKCDLCSWKTVESNRETAESNLRNHLSLTHRKGRRRKMKKKPRILPEEKPPQIPSPIDEHS
jgi:hypothetical protein